MTQKLFSRALTRLTLAGLLFVATTLVAQQLAPRKEESDIARMVVQMIEREHMSRHRIDDEVSTKLVDKYVKEFDSQKLYFLQSDIDDMARWKTQLDDQLKVGNLDFAFQTFDLYLKRLDERIDYAQAAIDQPHDFAVEEDMIIDAKNLPFAQSVEELNERWRKRIKYELLQMKLEAEQKAKSADAEKKPADAPAQTKVDDTPGERLHKRYRTIKRNFHQMEREDVLELYLTALANCLDPHSSYMSSRTLKDFEIQMRLSLEGIGAALKSEDGYTIVASIVKEGAAAKDGRLKVGDRIVAVAQQTTEWVDVVEMKLSNVVSMIRGKRDSIVRLKVQTPGTSDTRIIELTRQTIPLSSQEVKGEIIDVSTRLKGASGKIGVINIPSFYRDFQGASNGAENFKSTARDVSKVLSDFKAQGGVDGVVIDLRTNGGGALSEAIEVSGLFIPYGPVVQVKDQNGLVKSHDDEDQAVEFDGPLVVVCNRLSASASEIFAGVIKDYHRGLIVGDVTTHGKGTVQNVNHVGSKLMQILGSQQPDKGALKLTIQQFYRVNGDSTQNLGVPSDVVLPSVLDHLDLGESSLDNAMAFDRVEPLPHSDDAKVTTEMVAFLRDRSKRRISHVEEFQELQQDIQKILERKERKTVSLNEAQMRKERVDEEVRSRKEVEEAENGDEEKEIFAAEFYNNELLAISLDYAAILYKTLEVKVTADSK